MSQEASSLEISLVLSSSMEPLFLGVPHSVSHMGTFLDLHGDLRDPAFRCPLLQLCDNSLLVRQMGVFAARRLPFGFAARRLPIALAARRLPLGLAARRLPLGLAARRLPFALAARRLPFALAARRLPFALVARRLPFALVARRLLFLFVIRKLEGFRDVFENEGDNVDVDADLKSVIGEFVKMLLLLLEESLALRLLLLLMLPPDSCGVLGKKSRLSTTTFDLL